MTHLNELHFGDVILGSEGHAMVITQDPTNVSAMGRKRSATRIIILSGEERDIGHTVAVPDDLICQVEDYA